MKSGIKGLDKIDKNNLSQWRCQYCRRLMFFYGMSPNQIGIEKETCPRCKHVNNVFVFKGRAQPLNSKVRQKLLIQFKERAEQLDLPRSYYYDILELIK